MDSSGGDTLSAATKMSFMTSPEARSGATLRRPVQVVKKRSGPLDEALAEVNKTTTSIPTATTSTTTAAKVASATQVKTQPVAVRPSSSVTSPSPSRRRYSTKDKEKKRERWLLTRKTWKYMTDAGRKLIPDGAQNRKEDIPKIEAHFQQICAAEPSYILWRRKSSYPGAMRNSKKRLKQLLQHTGQRSQHVIEQEEVINADQVLELLHSHLKLDEAIKTDTLLGTKTVRPDQTSSPSAQRPKPSGSAIRRACGYGVEGSTPVSLRGPGFLPPAHSHLQQLSVVDQLLERLRLLSRSQTLPDTINVPPEKINSDLLNDRAALKKIYTALKKQQLHRILSKHSMPPKPRTSLSHSSSMLSLLHFGGSSSNIKVSKQHDKSTKPSVPTTTTTSASTKTTFSPTNMSSPLNAGASRSYHTDPLTTTSTSPAATTTMPTTTATTNQRQRKPPSSLNLPGYTTGISSGKKTAQVHRQAVEKNSCGTQTNFIQLNEIKRLAEEYKEYKREEAAAEAGAATTDDEAEKQGSGAGAGGAHHNRRKSSIDNEDVSQSVSDTIKRYLRMARKKSVHDDNANRFKRVNYDRNLRNIRAKGEINPPGMDEDNDKAVQTLDAWALITLDFIRGNENSGVLEMAHKEWQKALDERIRKKLEYEQKLSAQKDGTATNSANQQPNQPPSVYQSVSSCSSSSAPTSPTSPLSPTMTNRTSTASSCSTYDIRPTIGPGGGGNENSSNVPGGGIFHSSSQFIANLWHGATSSSNSSSPTSAPSATATTVNNNAASAYQLPMTDCIDANTARNNSSDMQKSKSSSQVGHFVSRKILRSRSKSQTRPAELSTSPSALSKWRRLDQFTWTSDSGDRILLLDTTFHNLSDLEAKMVQKVSMEKISELNIGINLTGYTEGKSQKRRILAKKKAMTTSFFDIGKRDYSTSSLSLFGNSLESCVVNDKKREISNLSASMERGSRNSIASLFRVGSSGSSAGVGAVGNGGSLDAHKLGENVRSCESLPSGSCDNANSGNRNAIKTPSVGSYFGNLAKSASMQISRSQTDIRRKNQEIGSTSELGSPTLESGEGAEIDIYKELQVPKFVMSCINYLEENGLHKVGLFRVSTSKKRVKQLREDFDKNAEKNFDPDTCPHNVATLLKEFLRDLPEPLLCNGLYKAFLETQKIRNRRLQLEAISHLVKLLPPAHRDTLYVLLRFLAKVAASSDDVTNSDGSEQLTGNKMDSNNLATVFAPNILRSSQSSSTPAGERLQSTNEQESISDAINVIRIMIDHYEELFRVSAELLDVVYTQLLDESPEDLYTICEYHSNLLRDALKNRHSDASKTCSLGLTDRRQSSPNVFDQAGIVSASLQIPMHINYGSSDEIVGHTYSTNLSTNVPERNFEFGDIPYMEDFTEQSLENRTECFQVSGTLKFSTKKEVSSTEATEKSKNLQPHNKDLKHHNGKMSNLVGLITGSGQNSIATTSKDSVNSRHLLSNEPKLPASITNIGGAILRSKTADFERMSNRKKSSSPLSTTSAVIPSEAPATMSANSGQSKTSGHQHLYKRQELIPSAKRSQHK